MFHKLHKVFVLAIVVFWFGVAALFVAVIYQNRSAFSPLADGITAVKAWMSTDQRVVGEISGTVTKVEDDYAFQMKDPQGLRYQFRLAGIEIPNPAVPVSKAEAAWRKSVRTNFSQMILSKEVRVVATFLSEQRAGMGMVFMAETNVNALLVEQGLAKIKPEYLKGLPLKPYYTMLRSQRRAQTRRAGMWGGETVPGSPAAMRSASATSP